MRTLIFFLLLPVLATAQLLDDAALDSVHVFTDLEQALENPEQVYALDLSRQKLTEVPPQIALFTNLNKLILNRNRIKEIPEFISKLVYLQEFRCSRNRIKAFPQVICSLVEMDHLALGKNSIESIPPCISKLSKLRVLDLWGNEVGELPDEISNCEALRYVDMRTILLSEREQIRMRNQLPWVKFYFNQPCNCE